MKKLCFFLLALLIPVIGFAQEQGVNDHFDQTYYLVGDFNGWSAQDQYKFSKQDDGSFVLDFPGNLSGGFKVNNGAWDDNYTCGSKDNKILTVGEVYSLGRPGGNLTMNTSVDNPHIVFYPDKNNPTLLLTVGGTVDPVDPTAGEVILTIHGSGEGHGAHSASWSDGTLTLTNVQLRQNDGLNIKVKYPDGSEKSLVTPTGYQFNLGTINLTPNNEVGFTIKPFFSTDNKTYNITLTWSVDGNNLANPQMVVSENGTPVDPTDGPFYAIHGTIHDKPACTKNPDSWHSFFLEPDDDLDGWYTVTTNFKKGGFGVRQLSEHTDAALESGDDPKYQLKWFKFENVNSTDTEYKVIGDKDSGDFNLEGLYTFMWNPEKQVIKVVEEQGDLSTIPVSVTLEFASTGNSYTGDISNGFFNMRSVNVTSAGLRIYINYADGSRKAVSTSDRTYAKGEQPLYIRDTERVTLLPHDINYDQVYNIEMTWNGKFNDAKLKVIDVYPDQPVAYYLNGSFNNWDFKDSDYKFTEVIGATNLYELNVTSLPAGTEFRIDRGNGENRQEQFGSNGSALIPGQSYIAQKGTDNGIRINNGVALNNVRIVFNSETGEITIYGEHDQIVPVKVYVIDMSNGDVFANTSGLLEMNGRKPGYGRHGLDIRVVMSDGTRRALVLNDDHSDDVISPNVVTPLILVEDYYNTIALNERLYDEDTVFNITLDWNDLKNGVEDATAKLSYSIVGEGESQVVDWGAYQYFRIHGNINDGVEGYTDSENFEGPDADGWYHLTVDMVGEGFGIKQVNAAGNQLRDEEGHTEAGWWYGVTRNDDYYLNDDKEHSLTNALENEDGRDFVLGQPGKYTFYINPSLQRIRIEGEHATANMITVYFVDRKPKKLNSTIYAYVYNNDGLNPDDSNAKADEDEAWPGVKMTKIARGTGSIAPHPLYNLIDDGNPDNDNTNNTGSDNVIWTYTFDANRFPQIIFNDTKGGADHQTRNFRAEDGGVYFLDDEFLPSNYYKPEVTGNDELYLFPNVFSEEPSNTIYVDVPEFIQYAEAGGDVSISMCYKKGKEWYYTTGIRGTSTMILVEIAGKKYLKFSMTEAGIPDGTDMILRVWLGTSKEHDNGLGSDGQYYGYHGCDASEHHHASNLPTTGEPDHWNCEEDPYRVLLFTNVKYEDQHVYNRGGSHSIYDDIMPKSVVLKENGAGKLKVLDQSLEVVDSNAVDTAEPKAVIEMTDYMEDNVLMYKTTYITRDSQFTLHATMDDGTEYTYFYEQGKETKMTPLNLYETTATTEEVTGTFAINNPSRWNDLVYAYDVFFNWTTHEIHVEPVTSSPNFTLHHVDPELADNDYYTLLAVANDRESQGANVWKDESGKIIIQPMSKLHVKHRKAFGGEGTENVAHHYGAVTTTLKPKAEYDKYFEGSTHNQHPEFRPLQGLNKENEGDYQEGEDYISYVEAKAYTAGKYTMTLTNTPIRSTENSKVTLFQGDTRSFDVLVRPTIEGVGLAINGSFILPGKSSSELQVYVDPTYVHNTPTETGVMTWDPYKRMAVQSYMANNDHVEVYMYYEPKNERPDARRAPKSIVRKAAPVFTDVEDEEPAEGLRKWDATSGFNLTNLMGEDATDKKATVQMQVKQNGILGPVQNVTITTDRNDPNNPTEVEEIEVDDTFDGEAVYYDINGIRVDAENLLPGIYVVVKGDKTEKIYIK